MRITGGNALGRTLRSPRDHQIRPTSDKVRAAIFNSLEARHGVADRSVLDLFCGTGSLGIEALSRGATRVTFVDASVRARRLTEENLALAGFASRAAVVAARLPEGLARLREGRPFEGVLIDPPYDLHLGPTMLEAMAEPSLLAPNAWVVLEHRRGERLPERMGLLEREVVRRYGDTEITIYSRGGAG